MYLRKVISKRAKYFDSLSAARKAALIALYILFCAAIIPSGPAHAAAAPAGQRVTNISSASYLNGVTGLTETVSSNAVDAVVNSVPGFTMSGDVTILRSPGQSATFAYTIANTGNTNLTLEPAISSFAGDFTLSSVQFGLDTNANGLLDPAEVLSSGSSFVLALGVSQSFLVEGDVAALATTGQSSAATLSMVEASIPQTLNAQAIVNVEAATLEIVKTVSAVTAFPGDILTYTLEVTNPSGVTILPSVSVNGFPITIDGAGVSGIILRDNLPNLVNFDSFGQYADFTPVFRLVGDDDYTFTSTQPASLAQIEDVAFILETSFVGGAQRSASFNVQVAPITTAVSLPNSAAIPLPQPDGSVMTATSNLVTTFAEPPAAVSGEIVIYEDPGFSTPNTLVSFGDMIYVETQSDICNLTAAIDTIQITITSQPTNDREVYDAIETGPNTGIFRIGPIPVTLSNTVTAGDANLHAGIDDVLAATPQCDPALISSVPVETVGVVFVSTTNQALAGITVNLFDQNDILVASAITDAQGHFILPTLLAGTYTVRLDGVGDFSSPSTVTDFSGFNREIDVTGSYGKGFTAIIGGGRIDFDIPVDPPSVGSLSVAKTAMRASVGLGETVRYEIEVKNASSTALTELVVVDQLPRGFSYIIGSAALDAVAIGDPVGADSPRLEFHLGQALPASSSTLSYAVAVSPNAGQGPRVNSAYATGKLPGDILLTSNTARVSVDVDRRGGVFSREGTVLGKVFHDANENQVQDKKEPGIPGVQLYTEEGMYVVTDQYGRFSFPRLRARTHVLSVYQPTLPTGSTVAASRVMDAGVGGSRFIPLRAGEIRSEDFAVHGCQATILSQIEARLETTKAARKEKKLPKLQLDTATGSAFSDRYEKISTTAIFSSKKQPRQALEVTQRTIYATNEAEIAPEQAAAPCERDLPSGSQAASDDSTIELPSKTKSSLKSSSGTEIIQQGTVARSWPVDRAPQTLVGDLCTYQNNDPRDGVIPQPECWIAETPVLAVSLRKNSIDITKIAIDAAAKVTFRQEAEENTQYEAHIKATKEKSFKTIAATRNMELEIVEYDAALAFLDLKTGDRLVRQVASVRIKGPSEGALVLRVNGVEISTNRIGQTVNKPGRPGVQALEYVAIAFQPGNNTLTIAQNDPFGNERAREEITITVPGTAHRLVVVAPDKIAANNQSVFPVIIKIVDAKGLLVDTPVEVTLLAQDGAWDVSDMYDNRPGIQSYVDGGEAIFDFKPSGRVGTHRILVESVFGLVETDIQFTADLSRPPVMVGYIEGAVKLGDKNIDLEGLLSEDKLNAFEETTQGLNGALFLKGKIKGDALLTLRYDSDRDTNERLFRDVEPDRFYPVYGDTSERGFDAQSRGEIFVKIEKGASYILYGDVRYGAQSDAFRLGGYQRSLEGAKAHLEKGRVRLNLYAAQTDATQQIVELPALGISGPYELDFSGVEENSEIVELITRDRDEPSVIIKTQKMSRFSNYTLDYFTHSLIFNAPVESVDENLNPVSIRVTFEVPNGAGEKYMVYGGEGRVALAEGLAVGYRELRSDAPVAFTGQQSDRRMVRAAFIEKKIGDKSKVQFEVAQTTYDAEENGNLVTKTGDAARLSFGRVTDKSKLNARIGWTSDNFNAPGATLSAGKFEARLESALKHSDTVTIRTQALYAKAQAQDELRYGVVGRVEKKLSDKMSVRVGARVAVLDTGDETSDPDPLVSAIAGLNWAPHFLGGATLDVEIEQALSDSDAFRLRLGTEYQVTPKMRAYILSEWSNSDRGEFAIVENKQQNTTIRGGVEYKWTKNIKAFSEYRANQSAFDAGLANGLTANWDISESLSLRSRIEHVEPLTEVYQGNSAASVGATWQPKSGNSILSGDVEYATSSASDRETVYTNTTIGHKIGDTTLLARNRFARTQEAEGERLRDRMRLGAAYRPTETDTLNLLGWYEYGLEDTPVAKERRHIASVGAELKPAAKTRIRPTLGAQSYSLETDQYAQESQIFLGQLSADQDVTKRVNLGANIAAITDGDAQSWHLGVGVEANVAVAKNMLVGVGYNYTKVEDPALEGLYESGAYIRLRLKFDENSWDIFAD